MAGGTPGFIELYVVFVHLILSTAQQNQVVGEIKGIGEVLAQITVVNRERETQTQDYKTNVNLKPPPGAGKMTQ